MLKVVLEFGRGHFPFRPFVHPAASGVDSIGQTVPHQPLGRRVRRILLRQHKNASGRN